jgi:hypothetical protein
VARDHYGCATRRQKGLCENSRTIARQELEARVLSGLKERLLAPQLTEEFVREFNAELVLLCHKYSNCAIQPIRASFGANGGEGYDTANREGRGVAFF